LWGEEPKTRLIPDGEGGFIVERERQFTPDDIQMFEAARIAEESISPRGIPYEDETNPENRGKFAVGDEDGRPFWNYATLAVEQAQDAYKAKNKNVAMEHLSWPVRLVT